MKFVTLALAAMALAVPATLLFTSSNGSLMIDRSAKAAGHGAPPAAHAAGAYASG